MLGKLTTIHLNSMMKSLIRRTKMQAELIIVTPEMAKRWLGNNPVNRTVKHHHVLNISRDIIANRWQINGATICICEDGTLLDGQHRLLAIVKANLSIRTHVIQELPREGRDSIDSGVRRTAGDRLTMAGEIYGKEQSSIANFLISLAHEKARSITASQQEILYVTENHNLVPSCGLSKSAFPKIGTILGGLHYIACYNNYHQKADEFISVFKTGIPTYEGDAAHFAREYLISQEIKQTTVRTEFKRRFVVHCFNKFMNGVPVKASHLPNRYYVPNWRSSSLGINIA